MIESAKYTIKEEVRVIQELTSENKFAVLTVTFKREMLVSVDMSDQIVMGVKASVWFCYLT